MATRTTTAATTTARSGDVDVDLQTVLSNKTAAPKTTAATGTTTTVESLRTSSKGPKQFLKLAKSVLGMQSDGQLLKVDDYFSGAAFEKSSHNAAVAVIEEGRSRNIWDVVVHVLATTTTSASDIGGGGGSVVVGAAEDGRFDVVELAMVTWRDLSESSLLNVVLLLLSSGGDDSSSRRAAARYVAKRREQPQLSEAAAVREMVALILSTPHNAAALVEAMKAISEDEAAALLQFLHDELQSSLVDENALRVNGRQRRRDRDGGGVAQLPRVHVDIHVLLRWLSALLDARGCHVAFLKQHRQVLNELEMVVHEHQHHIDALRAVKAPLSVVIKAASSGLRSGRDSNKSTPSKVDDDEKYVFQVWHL